MSDEAARGRLQTPASREWSDAVHDLLVLLLDGDSAGAAALVRGLLDDGATAGEVYRHLLTPVLHRVGQRWESGEVNVALEHRATAIVSQIMSGLSGSFEWSGPRVGVATTMTAPGEAHGLAAAMVADFLRADGWDVHHLGADVPVTDLRLFLDIVPVDVVCISAHQKVAEEVCSDLAQACRGRQLIMGGPGVDPAVAVPLGIVVLQDPEDLLAHLRGQVGARSAPVGGEDHEGDADHDQHPAHGDLHRERRAGRGPHA